MKFASCDGCQLQLLDLEDELLAVFLQTKARMAQDHRQTVERGLALKKSGNELHARSNDGLGPYLLGPAARVTLCADELHPVERALLDETGVKEMIHSCDPCISCATHFLDLSIDYGDDVPGPLLRQRS